MARGNSSRIFQMNTGGARAAFPEERSSFSESEPEEEDLFRKTSASTHCRKPPRAPALSPLHYANQSYLQLQKVCIPNKTPPTQGTSTDAYTPVVSGSTNNTDLAHPS